MKKITIGGKMYKVIVTDTKDVWLGTEKAVIKFANEKLNEKGKKWMYLYQDRLLDMGFIRRSDDMVEEITNIQLATKYLNNVEDILVYNIEDILDDLKKDELILLSQEE